MKYVRLIDGVYKVIAKENIEDDVIVDGKFIKSEPFYIYWLENHIFNVMSDEIIAEADTIEELCDCLMFVNNDEKEDFLITDVNEINIAYSKNETCYACLKIKLPNGAIRIEPVAKFNEKWSFELI